MTTRIKGARRQRDTYFELVKRFPLRPIRSERELERATEVVDSLIDRDDLDPDELDYLDVLGDLTDRYEQERHPLRPVTDAEMLAFLIEHKQATQSAVARATGIAVSTISAVSRESAPSRESTSRSLPASSTWTRASSRSKSRPLSFSSPPQLMS